MKYECFSSQLPNCTHLRTEVVQLNSGHITMTYVSTGGNLLRWMAKYNGKDTVGSRHIFHQIVQSCTTFIGSNGSAWIPQITPRRPQINVGIPQITVPRPQNTANRSQNQGCSPRGICLGSRQFTLCHKVWLKATKFATAIHLGEGGFFKGRLASALPRI